MASKYYLFLLISFIYTYGEAFAAESVTYSDPWPKISSPFHDKDSKDIEKKIDRIINKMSIEAKVGQMIQAEIGGITQEEVAQFHIGAVFVGGGRLLNTNKQTSLDEWVSIADAYWKASTKKNNSKTAIPIIIGIDAIHGNNKLFGATLFPHNIGLGASRDGELVKAISTATAQQMYAAGMNWTYAPTVSIPQDTRWGRVYESYSENSDLVALLGAKAIEGYQGELVKGRFKKNTHQVSATAKHFIADGGTLGGVDRGDNQASEQILAFTHGKPYFSAIEAGALWIMASHNSWHGNRLHGEKYLLTEVLKGKIGFDGAIVGDWNSHGMVDGCTNEHCPAAINAGMDMLMVPFKWKEFIGNTLLDVKEGRIPESRIDDAVRRILRSKFRAGVMDSILPSQRKDARNSALIASATMKSLAHRAVRESLVLLKNNDKTLPIHPKQKILVTGGGANNIPMQTGGWTINWQANDLTNNDFPSATSIYDGIKNQVLNAGGLVELSKDGTYKEKPDLAIIIFGELPYAEWFGDRRHKGYDITTNSDSIMIEKFKRSGVKTVSIFISGRPMWINRAINASDAFVAAWLPGTEGVAVADVLFLTRDNKPQYDFIGKLPYYWPGSPIDTDMDSGHKQIKAPLFPFGYGLTYKEESNNLGELPTDSIIAELKGMMGVAILGKKIEAPWELHLVAKNDARKIFKSGSLSLDSLTISDETSTEKSKVIGMKWNADELVGVQFNNPNAFRDYSEFLRQNSVLAFNVNILERSASLVTIEMGCRGDVCQKSYNLDITREVRELPLGKWQTLSIDLNCFASQGIDFRYIGRAFGVSANGKLNMQVSDVKILPEGLKNATIRCRASSTSE